MMRYITTIILALSLGNLMLRAQDSTATQSFCPDLGVRIRRVCNCKCQIRPVNDYDGLNSLRLRLANPSWDGRLGTISTGLNLEDGRIKPLADRGGETDQSVVRIYSGNSAMQTNNERDLYLTEMERGEVPVGSPVFVFFRLAGTHIMDSPQLLSVNAAADLAIAHNLHVRIIGAADSATGSAEKNDALAISRAEHVEALMKKRGVPEENIEVLSQGGTASYEPVSANRNCRIELYKE